MIEGENTPFKDEAINTNTKHTNKVFELGNNLLQRFSGKFGYKFLFESLFFFEG